MSMQSGLDGGSDGLFHGIRMLTKLKGPRFGKSNLTRIPGSVT